MTENNAKYAARDIAKYFAECGENGFVPITPLKIQKMIYFAQGFYLALNNEPLIKDDFQAWQYGPVVNNLYWELKTLGSNIVSSAFFGKTEKIDDKTKVFLDQIWDFLKGYSAIELSKISHDPDGPWEKVYNKTPKGAISHDSMREYFKQFIENN